MTDLSFIRGANGLVPDGGEATEWFAKAKPGARVVAKVSVPRNGRFHRKFFAMLKVAYENWDKRFNLGRFRSIQDAISARKAAEREHQFHENHGKIRPDTSETSHA